ncbi:unnamed protein product [Phytophthora lilii]|uniref:Unnamed protein product n=1 Tax=Phytophthora lilii TaxID=2077276 RepID=A0A9W7CVD1_9STRA|nr:unnamed protein product [Phytophthora lilii]
MALNNHGAVLSDVLMRSEHDVEFSAVQDRVRKIFYDEGLKALHGELLKMRDGPNGAETLERLAQTEVTTECTLLTLVADLNDVPMVGFEDLNVPFSNEQYKRDSAEFEAFAVNVCRFLIDEAGADVNYRENMEKDADTPLAFAVRSESYAITKLLLDRGADNFSKVRALWWAADFADYNMIEFLIASGADVHGTDGTTALTDAVHNGEHGIVKALLAAGIDISRRDGSGRTAAEIAESEGLHRMAELLTKEVRNG